MHFLVRIVAFEILRFINQELLILEPHNEVYTAFSNDETDRFSEKEVEGFAVPIELLLLRAVNKLLQHLIG
jgi:hypothetical protein